MKEEEKSSEKELNETEANNLPDTEFKTMVIRIPKKLRKRMDELGENLNKNTVSIKKAMENKQTSQK